MDPRRRQELTRYGAPAAFLAAATIAVLLIKAGLQGGSTVQRTAVRSLPKPAPTTRATTTKKLVLTAPPATTSSASTTATTATTSATATTSTTATTATTSTTTPGARYYVIQSGDTLGSIAQKYGTTVQKLTALNPGVDPTALRIGQRIRVS